MRAVGFRPTAQFQAQILPQLARMSSQLSIARIPSLVQSIAQRLGAHFSRDVSRSGIVPSPTIRIATPVTLPTISA